MLHLYDATAYQTDSRSLAVVCAATPTPGTASHDHDHLELETTVRRAASCSLVQPRAA